MKFEISGRRLYSIKNPKVNEHQSIQEFTSISPTTNFRIITNFSGKDENINSGFQSSENNLNFDETNYNTAVNITIKYATPVIL